MVISQKFIGKRYNSVSYELGREKLKEFVIAIKGDLEKFSEIAPPTFPVVYQNELLAAVLFDKELKLNLAKLLHGEQEFIFYKPCMVGDTITSTGSIEKIFQKGLHDFVILKTSSKNQVDELVCECIWTFVVRGGNDKDFPFKEKLAMKILSLLPENPKNRALKKEAFKKLSLKAEKKIDLMTAKEDLWYFEKFDDNKSQMQVFIDRYMPQVYAGASGDFNIIHLDNDFGKSVGLGGYILHGMATMALGANFACYGVDPKSIKRYKARFSGVVKPLDVLTYRGEWQDNGKIFNFSAKNQAGSEVLGPAQFELY